MNKKTYFQKILYKSFQAPEILRYFDQIFQIVFDSYVCAPPRKLYRIVSPPSGINNDNETTLLNKNLMKWNKKHKKMCTYTHNHVITFLHNI